MIVQILENIKMQKGKNFCEKHESSFCNNLVYSTYFWESLSNRLQILLSDEKENCAKMFLQISSYGESLSSNIGLVNVAAIISS